MPRYKKHEWSGAYQRVMILAETGMKHTEIARKVGLSPSRISRIIHDDRFTARRDEYKEKAKQEIYEKFLDVSAKAADKIIHIMEKGKPTERIRLDAAKDILNYAGHKPREQIEHITNNYTIEDVNSAKKVIEEISNLSERLGITNSKFLLGEEDKAKSLTALNSGEAVEGTISPSPDRQSS